MAGLREAVVRLIHNDAPFKESVVEAVIAGDQKFKNGVVNAITEVKFKELSVQEILIVSDEGKTVGRISSGESQLSMLNGQPAVPPPTEFVFELCKNKEGGGNFVARHPKTGKAVGAEIYVAPNLVYMSPMRWDKRLNKGGQITSRVTDELRWDPEY